MHHASQVAHRWPTTTVLGAPTVVAVASGVTSMIVPYQFNLAPPTPEGTPHLTAKPITFETIQAAPRAVPITKDTDAGNVAEALLVVVLIIVIGARFYMWFVDAAGNVLARAEG